jgi:hypothetical protein
MLGTSPLQKVRKKMSTRNSPAIEIVRLNIITGIVLSVLSLGAIFWLIPTQILASATVDIGLSPRFFPYVSAISLLVLSLLMILANAIKIKTPEKLILEESEENEILGFGAREVANLLYLIVGGCIYMVLMHFTGFLVASTLTLGISMFMAGVRNIVMLLAVSIFFPLAVKQILWYTLEIYLP